MRIASFNYKGGCGKTTCLVNFAGALAGLGKRVMMIDFDPQQNLTQHFRDGIHHCVTAEEIKRLEPDSDFHKLVQTDVPHPDSDPSQMSTFMGTQQKKEDIVDVFLAKQRSKMTAEHKELWRELIASPNRCIQACNVDSFPNRNLLLLRGSPNWSKISSGLTIAIEGCGKRGQQTHLPVAAFFNTVLGELVRSHNLDCVLVDLCPAGDSAINKMATMCMDYILCPCFADLYNAGSVHGLFTSILPQWLSWRHDVVEQQEQDEDDIFPNAPPKVLPLIVTNYSMDDPKSNIVCLEDSSFFHTIKTFVSNDEWKNEVPKEFNKHLPEFESCGNQRVLFLVPYLETAIHVTHELGRTLEELKTDPGMIDRYFTESFARDDLQNMKRPQLQKELKKWNLPFSGNKEKLIDRLLDACSTEHQRFFIAKTQVDAKLGAARFESFAQWVINLRPEVAAVRVEPMPKLEPQEQEQKEDRLLTSLLSAGVTCTDDKTQINKRKTTNKNKNTKQSHTKKKKIK